MKTSLLVLALLTAPVIALAADGAPSATGTPAAVPAKPATPPVDAHAALRASKERSTQMGACQKAAADKGLHDEERKQFLASCANAKP
jgi:hypothetical protein